LTPLLGFIAPQRIRLSILSNKWDTALSSMKAMYSNAMAQNGEMYEIAALLTENFRRISSEAIMKDSRIIKILRYSVAPSISQMKFGQCFGLNSISRFENDRIASGTPKYKLLEKLAGPMAAFASENIDTSRFMWLVSDQALGDLDLAQDYARKWTCSIASDQNAQTRYRNWRKDQQEHAIASELVRLGYVKSGFCGVLQKQTDINIGEFTQEVRVQGRTRQKADICVRSKKSKKLVLVEAKAVGVELDSTKRIKECCDKASDWTSAKSLHDPTIVAVIAGFFNTTGLESLHASGIRVIWEHRLADLQEVL